MQLGYGQIGSVLSALHPDVPASRIDTRLKYFQRLSFPSEKILVGTGWRAAYDPRDLMRLVVAFELLAIGASPGAVAPVVDASWTGIEDHLRQGWAERGRRRFAMPLLVRMNGLGGRSRAGAEMIEGTAPMLRDWLQGADEEGGVLSGRAVTVLDAVRVGLALEAALRRALPAAALDGALEGMDGWAA